MKMLHNRYILLALGFTIILSETRKYKRSSFNPQDPRYQYLKQLRESQNSNKKPYKFRPGELFIENDEQQSYNSYENNNQRLTERQNGIAQRQSLEEQYRRQHEFYNPYTTDEPSLEEQHMQSEYYHPYEKRPSQDQQQKQLPYHPYESDNGYRTQIPEQELYDPYDTKEKTAEERQREEYEKYLQQFQQQQEPQQDIDPYEAQRQQQPQNEEYSTDAGEETEEERQPYDPYEAYRKSMRQYQDQYETTQQQIEDVEDPYVANRVALEQQREKYEREQQQLQQQGEQTAQDPYAVYRQQQQQEHERQRQDFLRQQQEEKLRQQQRDEQLRQQQREEQLRQQQEEELLRQQQQEEQLRQQQEEQLRRQQEEQLRQQQQEDLQRQQQQEQEKQRQHQYRGQYEDRAGDRNVLCPRPHVDHGFIKWMDARRVLTHTGELYADGVFHFGCYKGYQHDASGPSLQVRCQNGILSPLPRCKAIQVCVGIPKPTHGYLCVSDSHIIHGHSPGFFNVGTKLVFKCNQYAVQDTHSPSMESSCSDGGVWSNYPKCVAMPTCDFYTYLSHVKLATNYLNVINRNVTMMKSPLHHGGHNVIPGSTIIHACVAGYTHDVQSGPLEVVCLKNGHWTQFPRCVLSGEFRNGCSYVPSQAAFVSRNLMATNYKISQIGDHIVGNITLACLDNYVKEHPSQPMTIMCKNEQWTQLPSCKLRKLCPRKYTIPPNSKITESKMFFIPGMLDKGYLPGSFIQYCCQQRKPTELTVRSSQIYCQENGVWSETFGCN